MPYPSHPETAVRIRELPPHLVNQIRAGEVIESVGQLLKELLENALDAKSLAIDVHLRDGGLTLLQVSDQGLGMTLDELPLAFERHATSKIQSFEDLFRLHSYGFRGEALAGLASVSRVSCTSFSKEYHSGGKIVLEDGKVQSLEHYTGSSGTTFYIRDLFYNTPVRLKFLKSENAEKNHIKKIFTSFCLSRPEVRWSIKWDDLDKEIYLPLTPGPEGQRDRFIKISKTKIEDLLVFQEEYQHQKIFGLISKTSKKGSQGKCQFIFVNGRMIQDRSLHQAVMVASKFHWGERDQGQYALFLDLPPSHLDVNVHPCKTTVKFENPHGVFSLLTGAIAKAWESVPKKSFELEVPLFETTPDPRSFMPQGVLAPSSSNLWKITSEFSLFQMNEKTYLFRPQVWLRNYLRNNLLIDEKTCIPLLIGVPLSFDSSIDPFLIPLQNLGLHLDRMDEQTVIIRSLPLCLEHFPINLFVSHLLNFLLEFKGTFQEGVEQFLNLPTTILPELQLRDMAFTNVKAPGIYELTSEDWDRAFLGLIE